MVSEVEYSSRAKLLDVNPGVTCSFQGTRKTLPVTTFIKIGEGILGEAMGPNTIGAVEVASEGEDTLVSNERMVYQRGQAFK